ncbi:MAG: sugar phosphate nucleotidyltransferase, partial [Nitrospiria bacterium]
TLKKSGITDILVVSGREHAGQFINYLGSGKDRGLSFTYKVQEEAGGIADALSLAEEFVAGGTCAVILGDNIYEENFSDVFQSFRVGAVLFGKDVADPSRFGVVEYQHDIPIRIIEKPHLAPSNTAITGLYLYDSAVFNIIKDLKPSERGEFEITDVNNEYMKREICTIKKIKGFWSDAGTPDSLLLSSNWAKENYEKCT